MAYNLRYYVPWSSKQTRGYVYIYKIDSTDASQGLILMKDGIEINTTFNDWNEPIIQQNAQVTILNDRSDFFELLPLMTAEEREYKIKIVETNPSTHTYFEGYLNSDVVEQSYLKKKPIRLVASNYLQKMEYTTPTLIEDVSRHTFIDLISAGLNTLGEDTSIRVNMSLSPSEYDLVNSTQTALSVAGVENQMWWKNDIERENSKSIVESILKSFDSYLYWYDGKYYIERYDDLDNYPQKYVEYNSAKRYTDNYSSGVQVQRTDVSRNIFGYNHLNEEQVLTLTPGLNTLTVKLEGEELENMVSENYSGAEGHTYSYEVMYPELRNQWFYMSTAPAVNYPGYNVVGTDSSRGYKVYSNVLGMNWGITRYSWPTIGGSLDYDTGSIAVRFLVTIDETANSETLNIEWKFSPSNPGSLQKSPAYYDYKLRYALRYAPSSFIKYDSTTGNWYTSPTIADSIQTVELAGSSFEKGEQFATATVSVNISDPSVDDLSGDQSITLTILSEQFRDAGSSDSWNEKSRSTVGDIKVSVSGTTVQNNIYTATMNNMFLNKKEIELNIFDCNSLNFKNTIFTGTELTTKTSGWIDDTSTNHTLAEKLIIGKAKLYQRTQQTISSTIQTTNYLKPLSSWYDSNQPTKKFVLAGYSFKPTKMEYDCVWKEFDNDTSVNLNNE